MPHLTLTYTPNITTDMDVLCRTLCDTIFSIKDETGGHAFPPGGTRVMAFPAAHYAVADSKHDYAFMYLNLRIWERPASVRKEVGEKLLAVTKQLMAADIEKFKIGITIQIDETPKTVPGEMMVTFEDRYNSIHALFKK